jgi:hypothetical protein
MTCLDPFTETAKRLHHLVEFVASHMNPIQRLRGVFGINIESCPAYSGALRSQQQPAGTLKVPSCEVDFRGSYAGVTR